MLIDIRLKLLEVFSKRLQQIALMESRGGMEKREQDKVFEGKNLAPHLCDPDFALQQGLSRPVSQGAHQLRTDRGNLLH